MPCKAAALTAQVVGGIMVMLDAWRWCAETRMVLDVCVVDLVKK